MQNLKLKPISTVTKPDWNCRDISWKPLENTSLKLNVDAHLIGDGRWGLRFVLRRSDGRPIMVAMKVVNMLGDATTAKAMGVKVALDWICEENRENVIIKSDSKIVVEGINSHRLPKGYWGLIGNYCKVKMKNLHRVSLRWVSRQGNWAAHTAANWAFHEPNKEWYCNFPTPIFAHIQKDMGLLI